MIYAFVRNDAFVITSLVLELVWRIQAACCEAAVCNKYIIAVRVVPWFVTILLTKREVKMAGQVFFLHFYGPRYRQGPYKQKKRTRPISSNLDRTSLVNKGFII